MLCGKKWYNLKFIDMKFKLFKLIYYFEDGLNKAQLEINLIKKQYEIYRMAVKTEKFIDKIKKFANEILKKYEKNI